MEDSTLRLALEIAERELEDLRREVKRLQGLLIPVSVAVVKCRIREARYRAKRKALRAEAKAFLGSIPPTDFKDIVRDMPDGIAIGGIILP